MKPPKIDLHQSLTQMGESPAEPDWDGMEVRVLARVRGRGTPPASRRIALPAPFLALAAIVGMWALLALQPWGTARPAARPPSPNRMEQLIARDYPGTPSPGDARATYRNPSFERRLAALDLI